MILPSLVFPAQTLDLGIMRRVTNHSVTTDDIINNLMKDINAATVLIIALCLSHYVKQTSVTKVSTVQLKIL